jgi:hypothetical protein
MSGARAARALEARFAAVADAELGRLHRKTARLEAPQRSLVESIAAEVVRAIALRPAQALHAGAEPALVETLVRLFGVSTDTDDLPAR